MLTDCGENSFRRNFCSFLARMFSLEITIKFIPFHQIENEMDLPASTKNMSFLSIIVKPGVLSVPTEEKLCMGNHKSNG